MCEDRLIVPLICCSDGCYLYGDPHRRLVSTRPVHPLIIGVRAHPDIGLSTIAAMALELGPRNANGFYLGLPVHRYSASFRFDLPIQFCEIPREHAERALDLRVEDQIMPAYFKEALWP